MDIKIGDTIFLKNQYNIPTMIIIVAIDKFGRYECKKGLDTYMLDREFIENNVVNNKKVKYMNYIEVIKLLKLDKNIKIKRRSKEFILTLHPFGDLFKKDGYSTYRISIDDILAEDWYVVKNEKLHTFEEAIKALKEGATVHRYNEKFIYSLDSKHSFALLVKADILADDWIIIDKEEIK